MKLVISPYEFSAPSPAAMAGILLADDAAGLLTIRPHAAPSGAPRDPDLHRPSLEGLAQRWEWCAGLWRCGLIESAGHDALQQSLARIGADPLLGPLASMLTEAASPDDERFVESFARDLLRGGREPALLWPVHTALEQLAADHDRVFIRAASQRSTPRHPPALRLSLPVLTRAGGATFRALRDALRDELLELRAVIERELFAAAQPSSGSGTLIAGRDLERSLRRYEAGFRAVAQELESDDEVAGSARAGHVLLSATVRRVGDSAREASRVLARIAGSSRSRPSATTALAAPDGVFVQLEAKLSPWD